MKTYKSQIFVYILMSSLLIYTEATAQLVPRYSQFIMNEFLVNPASAGADALTTFNLTGRREWVGFGSNVPTPQSYSASYQTRLLKGHLRVIPGSNARKNRLERQNSGRVGLGTSVISDYNGAMQRTGISATYAYHLFVARGQLSLGFSGSFFQLGVRSKYLNFKDNTDEPMKDIVNSTVWTPDFSFGMNYQVNNFHVGISAAQLLESKVKFGDLGLNTSNFSVSLKRNYYLMSTYKVEMPNKLWEYEPSVLFQMYDPITISPQLSGPKWQGNILLRVIYQKNVWLGLAYRTTQESIVMFGFKCSNLFFSYSFDYGLSGISQYTYGSHEISVSLKLGDSTRRYPWMERY